MQQISIQQQKLVRGGGLFVDFLRIFKDIAAWFQSWGR
jgi:hypothetical protein